MGLAPPPATIEAQIVHNADAASAKARGLMDVYQEREAGDDGWIRSPGRAHRRPVLFLHHARRPDSGQGAAPAACAPGETVGEAA